MGLELSGRVKLKANGAPSQSGEARILLETDELILRGDVRARIARNSIRRAVMRGGTVQLTYDGGSLALTLGTAAEKFATKVLEAPKSRLAKMGILEGSDIVLLNVSDDEFARELTAIQVSISRRARRNTSLIVLGVETAKDLDRIASAANSLAPAGALWVIHPKGRDGVKDTDIFDVAKRAGLTYTKVARFSATHTAEKLVIPLAKRG